MSGKEKPLAVVQLENCPAGELQCAEGTVVLVCRELNVSLHLLWLQRKPAASWAGQQKGQHGQRLNGRDYLLLCGAPATYCIQFGALQYTRCKMGVSSARGPWNRWR